MKDKNANSLTCSGMEILISVFAAWSVVIFDNSPHTLIFFFFNPQIFPLLNIVCEAEAFWAYCLEEG